MKNDTATQVAVETVSYRGVRECQALPDCLCELACLTGTSVPMLLSEFPKQSLARRHTPIIPDTQKAESEGCLR